MARLKEERQEGRKEVSIPAEVPCPVVEDSVVLAPLRIVVMRALRRTEAHLPTAPLPRRRRQVGRNPVRTSRTGRISDLPLKLTHNHHPKAIHHLNRSRLHRLSPSLRRPLSPSPRHHPLPNLNPLPSRSRAQLSPRQSLPRALGRRHEKKSGARQKSARSKRPKRSAGPRPQPGSKN